MHSTPANVHTSHSSTSKLWKRSSCSCSGGPAAPSSYRPLASAPQPLTIPTAPSDPVPVQLHLPPCQPNALGGPSHCVLALSRGCVTTLSALVLSAGSFPQTQLGCRALRGGRVKPCRRHLRTHAGASSAERCGNLDFISLLTVIPHSCFPHFFRSFPAASCSTAQMRPHQSNSLSPTAPVPGDTRAASSSGL